MKTILAAFALTAASVAGFSTAAAAETFTVACNSTGQVCDATATLRFNADGPGVEYGITLKAPTTHCSAVSYLVYSNDGQRRLLGRTQFLNAGQWSYVSLGSNLARGHQTVLIGAEGQRGGCNTGRLQSWGVDAAASIVPR
jgi:PhoPQ-activated pathogenicity-related protein